MIEDFAGPSPTSPLVADGASGVAEIHGPATIRLTPVKPLEDGQLVLEFEYFCVGGVEQVTAAIGPEYEPGLNQSLPALEHRETFGPYVAKLGISKSSGLSRSKGRSRLKDIRLDLQMKPDAVLQIRNVRLRPERAGEFDAVDTNSRSAASTRNLKSYLSRSYDSQLTSVSVGSTEITIAGTLSGTRENVFLGDIPMETLSTDSEPYNPLVPVEVDQDGNFSLDVPRIAPQGKHSIDRLTSRWQLFRRTKFSNELSSELPREDGYVAISHARYADDVACRAPDLPTAKPSSKKGLGGWSPRREPSLQHELSDLGVAAVTVNINGLHQYVSPRRQRGSTPFTWQGRTYYANESRLQRLDHTFREAEKQGAMVSAILLISNPATTRDPDAKLLGHPDAVVAGKFAMPNVTSAEGIAYYGAILNLMAERWSRNEGVHGRVHHWIVHNEVDYGWVWTNAGRKTDIAYMDLYQRSMRLVDLIARQYDPNARAWITLTHHWSDTGTKDGYGSKRMLELLVEFCQAEGDFPWALAFHPYPQSLFNPRTWEDDQATFNFDTAKITPLNLEVLDAYMKLPEMRYRGDVRPVHLSENGFNSRDYSAKAMEDQAAGMALAWKKIENLSSIESWQYHNWIDNRREGGLRIGLRKFPDDVQEGLGKKPIWHVYQALGTSREDLLVDPYLKTIGAQSWNEFIHSEPIH